jgi:hypothetical protein
MQGVDLGGAIEEVLGDAYNSGIVTRYENNASLLLKRQA